jgi:hypothetical protein
VNNWFQSLLSHASPCVRYGEVTGDCPIDTRGESVVRCGEYLEGLRSEVGKLAEVGGCASH